jgi:SnoaL-like domain
MVVRVEGAERLRTWVEAYRKAWLSNDPVDIEALFTDDAAYYNAPFVAPARGRAAIVEEWLARKDEPGDNEFSFEILVGGQELGVVQGRTLYRTDPPADYRNLWLVRLDESGRCREFTEWWMLSPAGSG